MQHNSMIHTHVHFTERGPNHRISRTYRWLSQAVAGVAITLIAGVARAGVVNVGDDPLPMPSQAYPNGVGQTNYRGAPSNTPAWKDKSEVTDTENLHSLVHSYNPITNIVSLGNVADANNGKI